MDKYEGPEESFKSAISRARHLVGVFTHLSGIHTNALDVSDILRASVVLGISALDHLVHQLFLAEVRTRAEAGRSIKKLEIPFSILCHDDIERVEKIVEYVRGRNSYLTFVHPDKLGEVLNYFFEHPWNSISSHLGMPTTEVKQRLRRLYSWRNRIAHEADINPSYAGVALWPIAQDDVQDGLDDLEKLGMAIVHLFRTSSLPDDS